LDRVPPELAGGIIRVAEALKAIYPGIDIQHINPPRPSSVNAHHWKLITDAGGEISTEDYFMSGGKAAPLFRDIRAGFLEFLRGNQVIMSYPLIPLPCEEGVKDRKVEAPACCEKEELPCPPSRGKQEVYISPSDGKPGARLVSELQDGMPMRIYPVPPIFEGGIIRITDRLKAKYSDTSIDLINPRRSGSIGEFHFRIIAQAGGEISVDDYFRAGGKSRELRHDIRAGFLEFLRDGQVIPLNEITQRPPLATSILHDDVNVEETIGADIPVIPSTDWNKESVSSREQVEQATTRASESVAQEDKGTAQPINMPSEDNPFLQTYHLADITNRFQGMIYPDRFYEDAYTEILLSMVTYVLEVEGPIHEDSLVERIACAHDFYSSKRSIRERICTIARKNFHSSFEDNGQFYWHQNILPTKWSIFRSPNLADQNAYRPVEKICHEELVALAKWLQKSGTINMLEDMKRYIGIDHLTASALNILNMIAESIGKTTSSDTVTRHVLHTGSTDVSTEKDLDFSAEGTMIAVKTSMKAILGKKEENDKACDLASWMPKGSRVFVGGRDIGGMIYVGRAPREEHSNDPDKACIDLSKSVSSAGGDYEGHGLSYWPNYSTMEARSRATYLDWLATGRSDTRYSIGYVFLYFYGLERRVFIDQASTEECADIIAEVHRLLDVYGMNYSIRQHLRTFIDAARILSNPLDNFQPIFNKPGYDIPLDVLLAIGSIAAKGELLPPDWLLCWYLCHPETELLTPAKRAFPEFRSYFRHLFKKNYPNGMKIQAPTRHLKLQYHAASGDFVADLAEQIGEIPDVSGLLMPLAIAAEFAEKATKALDKYSRYLGRDPEGRGTLEAQALLPEVIRSLFPCPEMDALRGWVADQIGAGGSVTVQVLIERLEGTRPKKIGKRQLIDAADALAMLGIGMVPDPRFALRKPKFGEPVFLFELPDGPTPIDTPSDKYKVMLLNLAVGSLVAHADGYFHQKELSYLESQIEFMKEVSPGEHARLKANLNWMLAVPPDMTMLRDRLRAAPRASQRALGQIAMITAGADGKIHHREIKSINRLYSVMGLDTSQVYSDLQSLIQPADPVKADVTECSGNDFFIPPPPAGTRDGIITLDNARISIIMEDTHQARQLLDNIFTDDDEKDDEPDEAYITMEENDLFRGLDMLHRDFITVLLTKSEWDVVEFERLAVERRLMAAGALETLNEWAFKLFNEPLIEDYDGYQINVEVARQLMR